MDWDNIASPFHIQQNAFDKAFDVAHSDVTLSIGIGTYDYFGDGYTKWPAYIYPLGESDPIDTYYL